MFCGFFYEYKNKYVNVLNPIFSFDAGNVVDPRTWILSPYGTGKGVWRRSTVIYLIPSFITTWPVRRWYLFVWLLYKHSPLLGKLLLPEIFSFWCCYISMSVFGVERKKIRKGHNKLHKKALLGISSLKKSILFLKKNTFRLSLSFFRPFLLGIVFSGGCGWVYKIRHTILW